MSERSDLVSLVLGGLIVFIVLYFTGKITGLTPSNSENAAPENHPQKNGGCGCGSGSQAVIPVNEGVDISGRYIHGAPIDNVN